jgi:hypothetical protein
MAIPGSTVYAHRPAALGEWQLQRLLGAHHKRGAFSLNAAGPD